VKISHVILHPFISAITPADETTRLIVEGYRGSGFRVGLVPEGESGRQTHGGPNVPGPWAYAFPLCTVIDNAGGTAADIERERKAGLLVHAKVGEVLVIGKREYWIDKGSNRDNIALVPLGTKG